MAGSRPVLHLPIAAALCSGLYALSLATVTALQAHHEAEVTADRAPLVDAAARAADERARMLETVAQANAALQAATDQYNAAVSASGELDQRLSALAASVAALSGAAARIPASAPLPAAPGAVAAPAPPPVQGTTGASGQ